MSEPYRDMTEKDQETATKWFLDNGIPPPKCWGKEQTCEGVGNWFLPDREGLYCASCRNLIRGN
jgi:hypothetical protein